MQLKLPASGAQVGEIIFSYSIAHGYPEEVYRLLFGFYNFLNRCNPACKGIIVELGVA